MTISKDLHGDMRAELQAASEQSDIPTQMKEPITLDKLQYTIIKLKAEKSPFPDEISNEIIIKLGPTAKTKLLESFNCS